jgi:hypothetical protein
MDVSRPILRNWVGDTLKVWARANAVVVERVRGAAMALPIVNLSKWRK